MKTFDNRVPLLRIRKSESKSSKGTALIEFAIAAPTLLIILAGIFDISFLLLNFVMLEQAVREGVRTASRLPLISSGTAAANLDSDATLVATCSAGAGDPGQCAHVLMQWRIRHIAEVQNLRSVSTAETEMNIVTEYIPIAGPTSIASDDDDTVSATLTATYEGLFADYPMTVTYRSPYLYQRIGA